jgi:hypothetical protein
MSMGEYIDAVPTQLYKERTVPEIIKMREDFLKEDIGECTCDKCLCVMFCQCAYDFYNSQGDCLLAK